MFGKAISQAPEKRNGSNKEQAECVGEVEVN